MDVWKSLELEGMSIEDYNKFINLVATSHSLPHAVILMGICIVMISSAAILILDAIMGEEWCRGFIGLLLGIGAIVL